MTTDLYMTMVAGQAGVSGAVNVQASGAYFQATDVGRGITLLCTAPARQASTAYAIGAVFYSDYAGVNRVYKVKTPGTTAAFSTANTVPNYDLNAPNQATDTVFDGTCMLEYLGAGQLAWGFGVISAFVDVQNVTVMVDPRGPFPSTQPTFQWAMGAWSNALGWPYAVTFHQQRAVFGGSPSAPNTLWFSRSGDFVNMGGYEPDDTVLDTDAITIAMDDDQVNQVGWMVGIPRGLAVSAGSGEFLVGPASTINAALSPTNIRALRQTDRGSANIAGVRVSGSVLFVQRGGRKLREMTYEFGTDSFATPDLTQLSEDIAGPGFVEMAYQEEPDGTVWLVRADGVLVSMTYDREQKVRAWCLHSLGGNQPFVESVCCVPNPDGTGDDVYIAVRRVIAGATVRTIEYIRQPFRAAVDGVFNYFFVDCGLAYNGALADVFTGLDHLNGETVAIVGDGSVMPSQVVVNGSVTLPIACIAVSVGYPFETRVTTLPPELPDGGSIVGKFKRIGNVTLRFTETQGCDYGAGDGSWTAIQMRPANGPMSQSYGLFDGDITNLDYPGGLDRSGQISVRQTQPLPMTLLAIAYDMITNA